MTVTVSDLIALSRLLDEAIVLPQQEQESWLGALPEADRHLAAMLRELLVEQARAADGGGRLETLPKLGPDDTLRNPKPGEQVGPYRLIREIGRGGMAIVWLAERHDGAIQRTVALKMPLVRMTGSAQVERFERERDVLAMLAHPQIARLYDAGVTPAGHPFIVLEQVSGQPITEYCDTRVLDVPARIRLFLQVLAAVDHAHKHLVVHRDIKPSNVFVDEEGQVKLLDFGIAKLLPVSTASAVATALTRDAGCALTPRYAAPEQVDGRPVSTATDVYSLGVLLYELLTGAVPHAQAQGSMAEAVEAVLNADVTRPSLVPFDAPTARRRGTATPARLRAVVAGDIETVVLKALRKPPADRYTSVERFAEDLRACLAHRPIAARSATVVHRTQLFVRRHRAVSVAVALGTATALVFAGLAWTQHRHSLEEFARAEAVRDFMFDFVSDVEIDENRSAEPTGRDMLAAAVRRARTGFADQPHLRGELLAELGRMHRRLGDETGAMSLIREAVILLESSAPKGDGPLNKARTYLATGALADGRIDDSAALASSVLLRCADGVRCSKARYYARMTMCSVELRRGRFAPALEHARIGVRESEAAFGPTDVETAQALHTVAIVSREAGDLESARAALDRAMVLSKNLTLRLADRTGMDRTRALISLDLGDYTDAAERARALVGMVRDRDEQVLIWRLLANAHLGLGLAREALAASQQAISLGDDAGNDVYTLLAHQAHARAQSLLGQGAQAETELRRVIQGLTDAGYAAMSPEVFRVRRMLGESQVRAGDLDGGLKTLLAVAKAQTDVADSQAVELAQAYDLVGCVLREQGLAAEALSWHTKARVLLETKLPLNHPYRLRNDIYRYVSDTGPPASDSEATFLRAVTLYRNTLPESSIWRAAIERAMAQEACIHPRGDVCRLIL